MSCLSFYMIQVLKLELCDSADSRLSFDDTMDKQDTDTCFLTLFHAFLWCTKVAWDK